MAPRTPPDPGYRVVFTTSYVNWRQAVYATRPEQVGIDGETYGLLMDQVMVDETYRIKWTLSTVVFADGSAALKFSIGGGIDDLGSKMSVDSLAKGLVHVAAMGMSITRPTTDQKTPDPGFLYIYIFAKSGIHRAEAAVADL